MVKIFGRKVFAGNAKTLGRKIGNTANIIGRKVINTIDKVAPIASTIALAAGHPEIASAITSGQQTAHTLDKAIRTGINVATAKKDNLNKSLITFGDNVDEFKDSAKQTNDLLRRQ